MNERGVQYRPAYQIDPYYFDPHRYHVAWKDRHEPKKGTCFVIMPLREELKCIYGAIKEGLEGYECDRADNVEGEHAPRIGRPIMENVLDGINSAEVIIAEVTEPNPNVYYEIGIAHMLPKKLILITRTYKDIPFDTRHIFHFKYDLHNLQGLTDMLRSIAQTFQRSSETGAELILSQFERTERIVNYMKGILKEGEKNPGIIKSMIVRHRARYCTLSNIPHDPPEEHLDKLLLEERDKLIELLKSGAELRILMSPLKPLDPRGKSKMESLLKLLKSLQGEGFLSRCRIAKTNAQGANLFIFTNAKFPEKDTVFKGHAIGPGSGFPLTMVHKHDIQSEIDEFDLLFTHSEKEKDPISLVTDILHEG